MKVFLFSVIFLFLFTTALYASDANGIDTGDTAWVLASAALVLLMTPGLAMFYGGMVRRKNVLATIMHSFFAIALVTIQWILVGYSLSFGPDVGGIIGSLDWIGLKNVGLAPNPDYAATVPHLAFMIYQAMFAVITPALISGAFAERMNFAAFIIFMLLWTTLVYDPVAHWIWAKNGWMRNLGILDFAGGLVVHVSSGLSALAAALYLGKRRGFPHEPMPPHNLPLTVLGAGILWFGWFGFNAGSALSSGGLSTMAFVTTHTAATSAMVTWVIVEWKHHGKPTMFGAATGSIAGLATITPAAGFVAPLPALIIGIAAGLICYTALNLKVRIGYDDSLDAFGVHGVGGAIGTLSAGLFASLLINPNGANGLLYGNASQFIKQLMGVAVVGIYSFILTFIIFKITSIFTPIRVEEDHEVQGLDLNQHGENGYFM
ncbi:ammonia channel protein [Candidatus Magnetoovum chiemensis]|nr:ammonia channel protein [Candidatus Magnetoovum chiemensis]